MANYHTLSYSMLKVLAKSRKEFYHRYITKTLKYEDSPAFKEGRLLDMLITEPHKVADSWEILEDVKSTTRDNCVTRAQFDKFSTMASELLNHKWLDGRTNAEIFSDGEFQKDISWTDSTYFLPCKGRLDWLSNDKKLIIDIKTISSMNNVKYDVFKYMYDLQAAKYIRGVQHAYGTDPRFMFIFISKESPYEIRKIALSESNLSMAKHKLYCLYETYITYFESGEWSCDEPETILL